MMTKALAIIDSLVKSDGDITNAIMKQFKWNVEIPRKSIIVKVKNGWVILQGEVEWAQQKLTAEKCIRDLIGIKGISNNISIKQKADAISGEFHSFSEMKDKIYESLIDYKI